MKYQSGTFLTANNLEYRIREVQATDAALLNSFLQMMVRDSEYLEFEADDFNHSRDEEEKIIRECADAKNCLMLLAENNQQIIGYAGIRVSTQGIMPYVGVFGIAVHKEYQHQGIGSGLMNEVLGWARESSGLKKIILAVFEDNINAIKLYESAGFRKEGVLEKSYIINGRPHQQIIMGMDIS
ncbi:MAG: GNAT family N-acetyltransferase [Calditrichia bacterium]